MSKLPSINHLSSASTLKPANIIKEAANKAKNVMNQTTKSFVDLSTEELGFFMVDGRAVKTIFPR